MDAAIEGFLGQWTFMHEMTLAFADTTPVEHWHFSPHRRFAPFAKQFRHVVCVRGVYNDGIVTGAPDFTRKHDHYAGDLSRDALRVALEEKQQAFLTTISDIKDSSRPIAFFGRTLTLAQYLHVITQHEAIHQGEWSLYASLAGFETPLLWRLNWGL